MSNRKGVDVSEEKKIQATLLSDKSDTAHFYDRVHSIPLFRGLSTRRHICALSCEIEPQQAAPIFVVVHGTWATRSRWTHRDSKLVTEVTKRWPESVFYQFRWTGTNGARHRLVAAEVLGEELNQLAGIYPSSKIVVISHSHGGNVVAWAATDIMLPISAAIYLNTPFTQVAPAPEKVGFPLPFILAILGFSLFLPLSKSIAYYVSNPDPPGFLLMFVAISLAFIGAMVLATSVAKRIIEVGNRLAVVSNAFRRISRELVVVIVGDEPNAALGGIYFFQWLGVRVVLPLYLGTAALVVFTVLFLSGSAADMLVRITEVLTEATLGTLLVTLIFCHKRLRFGSEPSRTTHIGCCYHRTRRSNRLCYGRFDWRRPSKTLTSLRIYRGDHDNDQVVRIGVR
jgi:hypothetical protein